MFSEHLHSIVYFYLNNCVFFFSLSWPTFCLYLCRRWSSTRWTVSLSPAIWYTTSSNSMWVARPFEIVLSLLWPITPENRPDQDVRQNKQAAHWKRAIYSVHYQQLLLLSPVPRVCSSRGNCHFCGRSLSAVCSIYNQSKVCAGGGEHWHGTGFAHFETGKNLIPSWVPPRLHSAERFIRSICTGMMLLDSLHAGVKEHGSAWPCTLSRTELY